MKGAGGGGARDDLLRNIQLTFHWSFAHGGILPELTPITGAFTDAFNAQLRAKKRQRLLFPSCQISYKID